MSLNEAGVKEVLEARDFHSKRLGKPLFLMEGLWTRFFPAVRKAQEVVQAGTIGQVTTTCLIDLSWPRFECACFRLL